MTLEKIISVKDSFLLLGFVCVSHSVHLSFKGLLSLLAGSCGEFNCSFAISTDLFDMFTCKEQIQNRGEKSRDYTDYRVQHEEFFNSAGFLPDSRFSCFSNYYSWPLAEFHIRCFRHYIRSDPNPKSLYLVNLTHFFYLKIEPKACCVIFALSSNTNHTSCVIVMTAARKYGIISSEM